MDTFDFSEVSGYALRLANRNHDRNMIVRALMEDPELVAYAMIVGDRRAIDQAERIARYAFDRVASHPREDWRSEVPARLTSYRAAADDCPWPGRTGPTDRRVLEGAYLTAEIANSTTFGLSARGWATRVGMPWRTVNESSRRLEQPIGAISRVTVDRNPGTPLKWRISPIRGSSTIETCPGPIVSVPGIPVRWASESAQPSDALA